MAILCTQDWLLYHPDRKLNKFRADILDAVYTFEYQSRADHHFLLLYSLNHPFCPNRLSSWPFLTFIVLKISL
jgi:hypothetical protein